MKKILAGILGVCLAVMFLACKSAGSAQQEENPEEEIPEDVIATPILLFAEIQDIFPGVAHVFLVRKSDNTLWGCGYNRSGQLGIGEYRSPEGDRYPRHFVPIGDEGSTGTGITNVKAMALGENHTLLLKNDGTLWVTGENKFGELGMGASVEKVTVFTQVMVPGSEGTPVTGVVEIAAGHDSSYFIKNDGTLWAAGYNHYGQLGLGTNEDKHDVFTQVSSAGTDVVAVASGARHTVILKRDGTLWATGANHLYGQLGLGDDKDYNVFTKVETAGANIKAVGVGDYHTAILKNDNTLWVAGYNEMGQLGLGDRNNRNTFVQSQTDNLGSIVICGNNTTILKNNGTLWVVGDNTFGQLGQGTAGAHHSTDSFIEVKNKAAGKLKIKKVNAGSRSMYILMEDGGLWGVGSNRYGQLNSGYEDTDVSNVKLLLPQDTK
jgi:alpha-tubulin suppressor-like RCC1 family protein